MSTGNVRVIRDTKGAGLDALMRRLGRGEHRVLVGVPAGAGNEENGTSLAQVAAVVEFGGTVKQHARAARTLRFSESAFRNKDGFDSYRFAKRGAKRVILGHARAYTQEAFTIPARPFLRGGILKNLDKIGRIGRSALVEIARAQRSLRSGLELMGVFASGAVKRYMVTGDFEPNAPSTIKKKGSSKPTIDDAQLRQSITSVVEGGRSFGEWIRGQK